jgi:SAM-dependent methyltransferase
MLPVDPTGNDRRASIFNNLKATFFSRVLKLDENASVLDFGSGPRGYILEWSSYFSKAFATDIRDFTTAYSSTGVSFVKSDGNRVPLPDGSIDVVVSHSVLEHVTDIPAVLADMDRLLVVGGRIFITVSPLYYSATGLHNKRQNIVNWEHLDPHHQAYLSATPFFARRTPGQISGLEPDLTGSFLNKMTMSSFLGAIGNVPWQIDYCVRDMKFNAQIPPHVDLIKFNRLDLLTKGFMFVGTKLG